MPIDTDVDPTIAQLPPIQTASTTVPLFGAITLAATFGVELMLTAFVAWGRIAKRPAKRDFTYRAWSLMRPERDLQIYVAGIGLTLLLVILICWGWIRLTRRSGNRPLDVVAAGQVGFSIAGLIAFLTFLSWRLPLDTHEHRPLVGLAAGIPLSLVGIVMMVAAAIDYQFQFSFRTRRWLVWAGPLLMALSIRMQLLLAPAALELEMLIILVTVGYWLRSRRKQDADRWKSHALRRSAILAAMAIGSFAIYLALLPTTQPTPTGSLVDDPLDYRARIPVLAMILCVLLDIHWGSTPAKSGARRWRFCFDVAIPLLLCATIFVPRSKWMLLTGSFLQIDELHHWNYFALGPALAFARGRTLVTEIYSQYGVGWPFLFAMLRHGVALSYANLVGCSIIYGCGYIVALYLFLRLLLRDPIWAACGAILAVTLQIFSGLGDDSIIWNFPSSTMLRHPMDVWFFLVLLGHYRFGGKKWFVSAGAICGLAVLFELDTGIELLIVLCFYWMLHHLCKSSWQILKTWNPWVDLLGAMAAAGSVWLLGMALASRGAILHRTFWSQYFEGLHNQAFSGLGLLPIANVSGYGMAIFAGMLTIYFFAIGLAGARIFLHRGSEIDLFLGSLAAYGLGLLLLFVGRSHPLNLFHPMIPFAMVVVLLLYDFRNTAARDAQWTSFPWVLAIASLAMLWTKPEFAVYPSLLECVLIGSPDRNGTLSLSTSDLGGLSLSLRQEVLDTQRVVNAIKHLPARDRDVAVLDDRDTLLDYLSDRAPWSRYTSLFHSLLTRKLIAQTQSELLQRRPRYIVIRSAPPPKWEFNDTWTSFHRFVPRHYHLEKTVGGYEFWRLGH